MYVATELPLIPQARSVVKMPNESIDDVLQRADAKAITWPRLFRSSAEVELYGYEGDFPTVVIEDFETERAKITNPGYCGVYSKRDIFDAHVRETIENIENSPQRLKEEEPGHEQLPDKIPVIIAEKSQSKIGGTYIKHPNQKDLYLICCTLTDQDYSLNDDYRRSNYAYSSKKGITSLQDPQIDLIKRSDCFEEEKFRRELTQVISWHDKISGLPLMDKEWSYQIEFGLDPVCLYQVRPFKRIEKAEFQIKHKSDSLERLQPIVIGITPKKGIYVRVETDLYEKLRDKIPLNPDCRPAAFVGEMREANYAPLVGNLQVNIFTKSYGFLAHNDVRAMRKAQVTALFSHLPNTYAYATGNWLHVVADGERIEMQKVKHELQFFNAKAKFTLDELVQDITSHAQTQEILIIRSKQYSVLREELVKRDIPYRLISKREALCRETKQNEQVYYIYMPAIEIVNEMKK